MKNQKSNSVKRICSKSGKCLLSTALILIGLIGGGAGMINTLGKAKDVTDKATEYVVTCFDERNAKYDEMLVDLFDEHLETRTEYLTSGLNVDFDAYCESLMK